MKRYFISEIIKQSELNQIFKPDDLDSHEDHLGDKAYIEAEIPENNTVLAFDIFFAAHQLANIMSINLLRETSIEDSINQVDVHEINIDGTTAMLVYIKVTDHNGSISLDKEFIVMELSDLEINSIE